MSKPLPVVSKSEDGKSVYEGKDFTLQVEGEIKLPYLNPPLAPSGQTQMEFSATLHSPSELMKGMPAMENMNLNDCTYSN